MPPRRRTFQRSRSHGPSQVERTSSNTTNRHSAPTSALNTQLIPYLPWRVILYRRPAGQVVLHNQESNAIEVRHVVPQTLTSAYLQQPAPKDMTVAHRERTGSLDLQPYNRYVCPTCLQSLPTHASRSWEAQLDSGLDGSSSAGVIADRDYFNMLARSLRLQQIPLALSEGGGEYNSHLSQERVNSETTPMVSTLESEAFRSTGSSTDRLDSDGVAESSFNQGYYERFFSEQQKLGKGLRGSVFSCQHILDNVYLGHYAVKKVAVGNNRQWLKRMLREVKLLESLRHPNVVEYKHSWLEMHQMTMFGPKVPCLFILMEYANGGNLQEYMEPKTATLGDGNDDSSVSLKQKILNMRRKSHESKDQDQGPSDSSSMNASANGLRALTVEQIWSFFSDICEGLAHLHQLHIIHRDLKHMNLLLHWKDPGNKETSGEIPRLLLTDFGECEILSHIEKRDRTGATGTMEFMAPELIEVDITGRYLDSYSTKSDMWSLGMVLYYLCYSRLPFANIDDLDILRQDVLDFRRVDFSKISRPKGAEAIPPELCRIMQMLLDHAEAKRPDVAEVIQLLSEHHDMWHSRRNGESRFKVYDSDAVSSYTNTPRITTSPPGSPASGSKSTLRSIPKPPLSPKPSQLSNEISVYSSEQSSRAAQTPLALVYSPENAPVQTSPANIPGADTKHSASSMLRRHSTGQSPFHESGASTPLLEDSSDSGGDSSVFASPEAQDNQHDNSTAKLDQRSSGVENTLHAKRYLVGASNSEVSAVKRPRLDVGLDAGPVFCVKTGILLAKVYSLQKLGDFYGAQHTHMPYLMCISLVISAFDINHQSLRLSLILLAANSCIMFCWLYWLC
ncbi:putative serine/threonine-protein kinase iks1 [Coemansia sp. RSA 1853]|nr:putative serine/threonine-protein kinase iks1 [Coemansia sp. RSA 638]KAJ2542831.1 putative serine/threonine-protein kinase iks1 [Coemansia sp. RSA 1853]